MPKKRPKVVIDFEGLTQAAVAKAFGVKPPSVSEWLKNGCPRNADKTYSLPAVIAWRVARAAGSKTEDDWSTEKDKWLALGHRARTLLLEGKLVSLTEAAAWWQERVTVARAALSSVGQSVAPAAVGQTVQAIRDLIDGRLRSVCDELAREFEASLSEEDARDSERQPGVDVATEADAK